MSMSYEEKPKSMHTAALVTPPKDPKEQALVAASPTTSSTSHTAAPFTPIQSSTECGVQHQDFEPLPYNEPLPPYNCKNIFEGSPFSPNINNSWQLVYSPLQANPHVATPKLEGDKQEQLGGYRQPKLRCLDEVSSSTPGHSLGLKANDSDVVEKMPPLPDAERPAPLAYPPHHPHNQQWYPHPPPPYYYGYHHYGPHGYHQPPSHPALYPKPKPHSGRYHHAYRPPTSVPYGGHFSKPQGHHQPPAHQEYITEVTSNDVICGRGGAVNNHPGNIRFRKFIQEFKYQYLNEEKQRKPAVAMRVLEAVKPGRFLVKHSGGYLICGEDRAREKASQALREGAAKLRKDLADKKRGLQVGKALPSNDLKTLPSNEKVGEEFSDFVPPKKKVKQEPV